MSENGRIQLGITDGLAWAEQFVVTWRVDAISLHAGVVALCSSLTEANPPACGDGLLTVTVRRSAGERGLPQAWAVASVSLPGAGEAHRIYQAGSDEVVWIEDDPREFVHIEVRASSWMCSLTADRRRPSRGRVWYARTDLFERLGVKGGRYEPLVARWTSATTATREASPSQAVRVFRSSS
ncbi:MAG: hypothetical protein KAS72_12805 [Phycisphaerales bacterium]|nr:hypothetical protein [Phycisphaerales bacterium]